jgi:hypothetical protein
MPAPLSEAEELRRWQAWQTGAAAGLSKAEVARSIDVAPSAFVNWLIKYEAGDERRAKREAGRRAVAGLGASAIEAAPEVPRQEPARQSPAAPASERPRRWLLTAAQDDTDVHAAFLGNLRAFAAHLGAELLIAGFTYQKGLFEDHSTRTALFRAEIQPFMRFAPMELGPVWFFANMNILPTAVRPLEGLATHSRGRPAVFPHAKLQLATVPAMPGVRPPIICTTGCVTVANYIQKKAGIKAELHHILGATVVEVAPDGAWFLRPISATPDGAFQDLDAVVRDGRVSTGARVRAITWGDIHTPYLVEPIRRACWGPGGMRATLRPRTQFFHDLIDFRAAARQTDGDPIHRAKMVWAGTSGMEEMLAIAARFLRETQSDDCESVIIKSNHDARLERWARQPLQAGDVENAEFWHACNLAALKAARQQDDGFDMLLWALRAADPQGLDGIEFVPIGGSYVICHDSGGIECGLHGHEGPNGTKGTAQGLARTATRLTVGDKHAPQILDGVYVTGISGDLRQGYNTGPGSWWHAHVVTYASGKRTMVAQTADGRWRA